MSKLSIQADFQFIKFALYTSTNVLKYPYVDDHYQFKLPYQQFQQVLIKEYSKFISTDLKQLQHQLEEVGHPLEEIVGISGFGTQQLAEFEQLAKQFKQMNLVLQKQKGIHNSIQAIDRLIKAENSNFFRFDDPIELKYMHDLKEGTNLTKKIVNQPHYPYLFINVNRSVSFYKVTSSKEYVKINGSLITDTTIENLFCMLGLQGDINQHFQQAFLQGNNSNSDMTVKDIYGTSYQMLNLPKDIIASSLGKLQTVDPKSVGIYDIVKSMWYMFAINLGHLGALNAKLEGLNTVVVGSSKITIDPFLLSVQSTLDFFGSKELDIYFMKNSEYLACF